MSVNRARAGTGVMLKMGDDAAQTVTVGAGGAALGATSVPVQALAKPLPNGKVLTFTGGRTATLTAPAVAGATTLTVSALAAALVAGDTAPIAESFTTLGELIDLGAPNETTNTFETTRHLSPGNRMEFGVGMTDPGEATATLNWDPRDPTQDGTTGLRAVQKSRKLRNFQTVYPFDTPYTEYYAALVTNIAKTVPIGDRMTSQVTLKISGEITDTPPV